MLKQDLTVYDPYPEGIESTAIYANKVGQTYFEINNYLGNVNAVITDRKSANLTPSASNASTWEAVVVNTSDYYPFGMQMPGRVNSYGTGVEYRYGYNGMEMDNEVSGNGNSYTTEFRQYDPRLGRWKSLDPLMMKFPWMSPYCAFDNNPVYYVDPLGLESQDWVQGGKTKEGKDAEPNTWHWVDGVDASNYKEKGYSDHRAPGSEVEGRIEGSDRVETILLGEGKAKYKYSETMEVSADKPAEKPAPEDSYGIRQNFSRTMVPSDGYRINSMNLARLRNEWIQDAGSFCQGVGYLANGLALLPAAIIVAPSAATMSWIGRTGYSAARAYHYTFGMNGGYKSFLTDAGLQTAYGGDYNFTSGVTSLFLMNGTSIYTRVAHQYATNLVPVNLSGFGNPTSSTLMETLTLDNMLMEVYGNSKWGTPFLATYWQLVHYGIIGDYERSNKSK